MNHHAVFELQSPFKHKDLKFTLKQTYAEHAIGRLRILVTDEPLPQRAIPIKIAKILQTPKEKRSDQQISTLLEHLAEINPFANDLSSQLVKAKDKIKSIKPSTTVPVMRQLGNENLRKTHIQIRGNYLSKGKEVTPGIPAIFDQPVQVKSPNRLTLAKWLVNNENPLTSRVMTNRLWEKIFGAGIVATSEEFGSQGELPTHPELLDWLSIEFMENGWSMKHIHKLIALSGTYGQSSRVTTAMLERDANNRFFLRGPRFRMTAEMIRDNGLQVAGLLSDKMGGPPVYPPQPDGLWRQTGRNEPKYIAAQTEDRFRRGIYVIWRRAAPYASFVNFDGPDRSACHPKRSRTNTPLQALTLLNDQAYVEMALGFAVSILEKTQRKSEKERITHAVRRALSRDPSDREIKVLLGLLNEQSERLKSDSSIAKSLLSQAPQIEISDKFECDEVGAWFFVANALLNLDETITKG